MSQPQLYSIWHLNLMYSSIEEEQRAAVIEKCFWPLLKLADMGFKIGIEAPAQTLEVTAKLDPKWIEKFKQQLKEKKVEFVGSGYIQAIAPLMPASVNHINLEEGRKAYRQILDLEPSIWMLNEQAFSENLISEYLDQKIQTVVIDWCSAYSTHPEWKREWALTPQKLKDQKGREVQVLWSHSLAFQKFQRRVHDENLPHEYTNYLQRLLAGMKQQNKPTCFNIYGNDAEIFDFRPGRFHTEAALQQQEWPIIESLFTQMNEIGFGFALPSEAAEIPHEAQSLTATSFVEPVTVKKQTKYNVTRWSLTGRNSPRISQWCSDLAQTTWAKENPKEFCELWASDFRTHITEKRWNSFFEKIKALHDKHCAKPKSLYFGKNWPFQKSDQLLTFSNPKLEAKLNPYRGLSLESIAFPGYSPLAGRIEHGTFSHMDLSADWYSANTVLEIPGKAQATDLRKVHIAQDKNQFATEIPFQNGKLGKLFSFDHTDSSWTLEYAFDQVELPVGSLRLAFLTFLDGTDKPESIKVKTHLGGRDWQEFAFSKVDFDHGSRSTPQVTARQALGWTENQLVIETPNYELHIELEASTLRPLPMIEKKSSHEGNLIRIYFSLSECDETRKANWSLNQDFVRFKYRLVKKGK